MSQDLLAEIWSADYDGSSVFKPWSPNMHSPEFQVRSAHINEVDAVFDLYVEIQSIHANAEPEFCRKPRRDKIFEQFFEGVMNDPEQNLVLACADTAVVGFCQYFIGTQLRSLTKQERRIAYVNGLVVSKDFRRRGCGTALLGYVKDEAKKEGITSVGIDVWSFNTAAKACFSRAGFEVKLEHMWLSI